MNGKNLSSLLFNSHLMNTSVFIGFAVEQIYVKNNSSMVNITHNSNSDLESVFTQII
jgi:hypothetical protein